MKSLKNDVYKKSAVWEKTPGYDWMTGGIQSYPGVFSKTYQSYFVYEKLILS